MKSICTMLVVTTLTALGGCGMFTSTQTRLAHAEGLLNDGQYGAANIEIKNVLDKSPNNARAKLALARINVRMGNFVAAAKALDELTASPDAAAVSRLRMQVLFEQSKYDSLLQAAETDTVLDSDSRTLARAQALMGLGRCGTAIPQLRQLISRQPKAADAKITLASCLIQQGDANRAQSLLNDAVTASPDSASAWLSRAKMQRALGLSAEAEDSWFHARKLAPAQLSAPLQAEIELSLIGAQLDRGEVTAARTEYQRLLAVMPQNPVTELTLAKILLQEGNASAASETLLRLVTANSEMDGARLLLVSALTAEGRTEQAIQQVELLRQKASGSKPLSDVAAQLKVMASAKPESEQYWLAAGATQATLNQLELARAVYSKAQAAAPQLLTPQLMLARIDLMAGHADRALQQGQSLLASHPDDPAVLSLVTQAQVSQKKYADAERSLNTTWQHHPSAALAAQLFSVRALQKKGNELDSLRQWLARNPTDQNIRGLYADALRERGANRDAIAEYEKLATTGNAAALNNLAWLYYRVHDARAVETARRAYKLAPQNVNVADTYGWLLTESGGVSEGVRILKLAADKAGPRNPIIRYHFAVATARAGDLVTARALLQELVDQYAQFEGRSEAEKLLVSLPAAAKSIPGQS